MTPERLERLGLLLRREHPGLRRNAPSVYCPLLQFRENVRERTGKFRSLRKRRKEPKSQSQQALLAHPGGRHHAPFRPIREKGRCTTHQPPLTHREKEGRGNVRRYGSGWLSLCTSFSASFNNLATARGSWTSRFLSNRTRISIARFRQRSRRTYLLLSSALARKGGEGERTSPGCPLGLGGRGAVAGLVGEEWGGEEADLDVATVGLGLGAQERVSGAPGAGRGGEGRTKGVTAEAGLALIVVTLLRGDRRWEGGKESVLSPFESSSLAQLFLPAD